MDADGERYDSGVLEHLRLMSIPSEEDFALARAKMAQRDKHWNEISLSARTELQQFVSLHHFAIFPRERCQYHAIAFLLANADVADATARGFEQVARKIITEIVVSFRGEECPECQVSIEFDSWENVTRNFGGSYFDRLR